MGRLLLETYPTIAGTAVWDGYLETLTTGTTYEGEPFTYQEVVAGVARKSGHSVRASRLDDHLIVSWLRHDTSERETRRLSDMQRLGNLGWASWNLVTDTVTWPDQVYAVFDRDPADGPMALEELPDTWSPKNLPALASAVERLLGTGRRSTRHSGSSARTGCATCGSSPRRTGPSTAPPSGCTASSRT
ncbi:hypothetical protein [Streptomyces avidinii]|uniref:Uncharacterized protein n=1 Tax=Streptomyces avidinii TaxID=1895 RepID=A0ABS4KZ58_STRAV|nr:hypothetical protein [Streptomyces avidinii]MBP2034796.1 hypothetical protein [Streptomyces avidinii]GGY88942.1 hypothetical protein GCM10010343_12650 [Streptomyces avidinii]